MGGRAMKVEKLKMSLKQKAEVENAIATSEANKVKIEYMAMMSDIDLPDNNRANSGLEGEENE